MVTDKDHWDEMVGARAEHTDQRSEARGSILRAADSLQPLTQNVTEAVREALSGL